MPKEYFLLVHVEDVQSYLLALLATSSHAKVEPIAVASRVGVRSNVQIEVRVRCLYCHVEIARLKLRVELPVT
jgi:hypothetical protein